MSARTPRIRRNRSAGSRHGATARWTRRPKDRPRRRTEAGRRMARARPEELAKGRRRNPRRGEMGGVEGHGLSRAKSHADVLQDAIVHGSKARDWNDDSDIDVLVIAADGAAEHYKALSNLAYDPRYRRRVAGDRAPTSALGIASSAAEASTHSRSRSRGRRTQPPRAATSNVRRRGWRALRDRRADDRHAPVGRGSGRRRRRRDERGHRAVTAPRRTT